MRLNSLLKLSGLFVLLLTVGIGSLVMAADSEISAPCVDDAGCKTTQALLTFSNQTVAANVSLLHSTPKEMGASSGMTGGAAVGDFNNDGWIDLFVIGGGLRSDALFINAQDGTFVDMAESAGLADLHIGSGATTGDYNNDGWLDIYVTSFGQVGARAPGQHRLYRNNGDLTFTNVAVAAGVNQTSPMLADGFGATFSDIDLDGDLDLFVTGWRLTEMRDPGLGNRLFRNEGDGTFTDITVAAGIIDTGIRGFSPCFADMDGDRYPELLLVADFGTTEYYINNGDGTFTEYTNEAGTGLEWSGMGTTVGDFNNDGLIDWYTTAIYDQFVGRGDGNKLYINQSEGVGHHSFDEIASEAGVANGAWGWGAVAADLDHDGWLDIVETNGWELPEYTGKPARVWLNQHDDTFTEVAAATGFNHTLNGRGLLAADFDNDGDQDFVVTSINDEMQLYMNDLQGSGINWLRVKLNTSLNQFLAPDGYGSRVYVTAGGKTYLRYLNGCSNYLTQGEMLAHFGLSTAATIDELRVEWADGSVTVLSGVAVNQTITIMAAAAGPKDHFLFLPFIAR